MTTQKRFRAITSVLFLLTAIGTSLLWQARSASAFFAPNYSIYARVAASDGEQGDKFGNAVAVSEDGNTLAIGAWTDAIGVTPDHGSVYIYTRGAGNFIFQQQLFATGNDVKYFGSAVALSGNTLVVGSCGDENFTGAVYIFVNNGGVWTQTQRLTASDRAVPDNFGARVSLSGNTLAISATGDNSYRGSVYIFGNSGGVWSEQRKLTASDGATLDQFGFGMALSSDTLVVGALRHTMAETAQGAAYVFVRNGSDWSLQQKIIAADGREEDNFGSSVAVEGNTAIIGAWHDDSALVQDRGSAYVFVRTGATWSQQAKLIASDNATDDKFGNAVTLNGDAALIGAASKTVNGVTSKGKAYLFARTGSTWSEQQSFITGNNTTSNFGNAVAMVNETLAIGAPMENSQTGAVYTYRAPNHTPTITPVATLNRSAGGTGNDLTIATVNDQDQPLASLQLMVNGGASATSNGVTVSNLSIDNATGTARATISLACNATDASFVLRVTDNEAAFAQALLVINVTLNTAPMLTYPSSQTIPIGGSLSFHPISSPIDNGSVVLLEGLGTTPGGFQGSVTTTNTQAGIIQIHAIGPVGTYTTTIRATDNCGAVTITTITYTVINAAVSANNLQFYPLAHPVRLLDTRTGATGCDAPGAKISGGHTRYQVAAGRTCDGMTIPANAAAVVGNITTVQSGGGYLTMYPTDIVKPLAANSNYLANQVLNNLFTVRLGADDGAFRVFVSSDTDMVVDIIGYYAPPAAGGLYFHPLPKPVRLLDTRAGATGCFTPSQIIQANSTMTQLGQTTCDGVLIPAGAQALVGNATTTNQQANGFLTLYPADAAQPLAASSNFQAGINMNSPFIVGLSPSGQFNVFTAVTTDLVIDVLGYYSTQMNDSNGQGLLFNSLAAPVRLLDTRAGQTACFTPGAKMTGGTPYLQNATGACATIPATAQAVVGNATNVNVSMNGYLTFWPSDANQPFIATSNYRANQVFNRHFTVGLGPDGAFKRYVASTTDLVIDLVGYFAP